MIILAGDCQSCVERSLTAVLDALRGTKREIFVVHLSPVPIKMQAHLLKTAAVKLVSDNGGTIHRALNPAFIPRVYVYDSANRLTWLQKSPALKEVTEYASKK